MSMQTIKDAKPSREEFEAWAKNEGQQNFMRMAGNPEEYDCLILRAQFKAWNRALDLSALVCRKLENELFDMYKGRGIYKDIADFRGDLAINGQSDGAGQCAEILQKMRLSTKE